MHKSFSHVSDQDWLALLKRSIREPIIDGVQFPGFPDEGTQVLFTSQKWEAALDEAFNFFQVTKAACRDHGAPLTSRTRYLDFGVGWGRITRMFLKDVAPATVHGVDVTPEILEKCKAIMPTGSYTACAPGGRLEFPDGSFDLVTAFSVFSHLSPANGLHWLRELRRVMRPGAIAVLTTLAPSFVQLCKDVARNPTASDWHKGMAAAVCAAYPDWSRQLDRLPKDEVLYLASGGGFASMAPSDYGWAMVPPDYARKHWGQWFEILEYQGNEKAFPQAYFVLRAK